MIQFSTLDRRYLVVVGNRTVYADTFADAQVALAILKFGETLKKILK